MDLISVIVPVYNVEAYLDKCISSIVNQTYRNLEIILVDDGSPDNCPAMCDAWAKKDSRIRVIHKLNGGLSDARNAGMTVTTGELMAFVDSDDWIDVHYIEYLYNALRQSNADISACDLREVYDDTTMITFAEQMPRVEVATSEEAIEDILKLKDESMHIVMTGRELPDGLKAHVDTVTTLTTEEVHPIQDEIKSHTDTEE